jgi:hypothetical protein
MDRAWTGCATGVRRPWDRPCAGVPPPAVGPAGPAAGPPWTGLDRLWDGRAT